MPTVFPARWDSRTRFRERRAFLTDILPADDGTEQRVATRSVPWREFEFLCTAMSAREVGHLEALLYQDASTGSYGTEWAVPYWPHAVQLTAAATAGASVALACDSAALADCAFAVDGEAVVWTNPFTTELVTVSAVGGSTVTVATLAASVGAGALLIPAYRARRVVPEAALGRPSTRSTEHTVVFRLDTATTYGVADYSGGVPA